MKTRKLALAAGAFAGLAALPLTTASAASSDAPGGTANAAALQVTLSAAPLMNLVDNAAGTAGLSKELSWQALVSQVDGLVTELCGTASCPISLPTLSDLPSTLTVAIGQANDAASLNGTATDIVTGHADSTPVATNWQSLNVSIGSIETVLSQYLGSVSSSITDALNQKDVAGALSQVSTTLGTSSLSGLAPLISKKEFDILGTVTANLPGTPFESKSAVQVTGAGSLNNIDLGQLNLSVDPFKACAANAAEVSQCQASNAQAAAANTLVGVSLPALDTTNAASALTGLYTGQIKPLLDILTNALANPTQAGTILSTAPVLAPLSGVLGMLGSTLDSTTSGAVATANQTAIDDLLKQWDTQVSAIADSVNQILTSLTALSLPDVTKLVGSANDIATAATIPTAAGGVLSTATASVGSLSILPVGQSLAGAVNAVLGALPAVNGVSLSQITKTTPVLEIDGITSSAQAGVGSVPACPDGKFVCGTSGIGGVSVLGQTISLDAANSVATLPSLGQDQSYVLTIPTVGSVTLQITRGLPQNVADTDTFRSETISALEVRLVNGDACTATCTHLTPALPSTGAKANTASPAGAQTGIAALGGDNTPVADVILANSAVTAGMNMPVNQPGGCTTGCSHTQLTTTSAANLPTTGMFGGGALPAGLLLIAVAISLRLLPSLRFLPRRVR